MPPARNLMWACIYILQVLARKGCHYQEKLGWERPGWFTDTISEVSMIDNFTSIKKSICILCVAL